MKLTTTLTALMVLAMVSCNPVYSQTHNPFTDGEWGAGFAISHHTDEGAYKEQHLLLGYYDDKSGLFGAIVAPNSYGDIAITAGRMWRSGKYLNGTVYGEVYLGAVLGYKDKIEPNYAGLAPYGWLGVGADISQITGVKGLSISLRGLPGPDLEPDVAVFSVNYGF